MDSLRFEFVFFVSVILLVDIFIDRPVTHSQIKQECLVRSKTPNIKD